VRYSDFVGLERSFTSLVEGVDLVGELLLDHSLTLSHVYVVTGGVSFVNLSGADDLVIGVFNEFRPVSEPSCESGEGEKDGEHLSGDAQGLVDNSRVEVDVRVELSLDEVVVTQGHLLEGHSNIDHRLTSNNGEDIVGELTHDSGSGVKVLVDSVAETLKHLLAVLNILDELGYSLNRTDLIEHAEDGFVGTTVSGSVEGSHGSSEGGVDISLRRGHMSDGSSGTVKFVLSMEDEQNIESFDNLGVRPVVRVGRRLVHHVKEVFNVTKVFLRLVNRLTGFVSVAGSSDGGGTSEHSVNVLVSLLLGVVDVGSNVSGVSFGVERAEGGHKSGHHSHRVRVVSEGSDERLKSSVVGGVLHDLSSEGSQLFLGGELSVDNEERGLQEGGLLGELLNRVTSVLQDSFVSINPGDLRNAGHGVHEGGVE